MSKPRCTCEPKYGYECEECLMDRPIAKRAASSVGASPEAPGVAPKCVICGHPEHADACSICRDELGIVSSPCVGGFDYPAAARSLHLNLAEFCDESLAYPEMVAEAGRRARAEIERLRSVRDERETPTREALFDRLANLRDDWGSYGAKAPNARAIDTAKRVLAALDAPLGIVPRANGGVQIEWHRGGIDVEISIEPHGGNQFFLEDDDSQPRVPSGETPTLADVLAWLRARPGASWLETIKDINFAVEKIRATPSTPVLEEGEGK